MATSSQLTEIIRNSSDPAKKELEIWKSSRYLVAQEPATPEFSDTCQGYYKGRVVIPGMKADKRLSETLSVTDLNLLKSRHYIRFVDNRTTDGAEESVVRALYTVMSNSEADEYEAVLRKLHDTTRSKGVSVSPA